MLSLDKKYRSVVAGNLIDKKLEHMYLDKNQNKPIDPIGEYKSEIIELYSINNTEEDKNIDLDWR